MNKWTSKTIGLQLLPEKSLAYLKPFLELGILNENTYLAGGALIPIWNPIAPVKDYDIFFSSEKFIQSTIDKLYSLEFRPVNSAKQTTYSIYQKNDIKIQLVTDMLGTPWNIISEFDLLPACLITDGVNIYTYHQAFDCVDLKYLAINKVTYPLSCLNRILKYHTTKGFTLGNVYEEFLNQINGKTIAQMSYDAYELDEKDLVIKQTLNLPGTDEDFPW